MTTDQQLIDVNRLFDDALERGDAAGAASYLTDHGVCITPDMPTAKGQRALTELFQTWIDAGITNAHDQDHDIEQIGDVFVMTCTFECEYRQSNGSTLPESGKALQVFVRADDDTWKIHRLCFAIDTTSTS